MLKKAICCLFVDPVSANNNTLNECVVVSAPVLGLQRGRPLGSEQGKGYLVTCKTVGLQFVALFEWCNRVCARTLLRTHFDTPLLSSVAWLVETPHEFAKAVLSGDRIDLMGALSVEIFSNEIFFCLMYLKKPT